MLKKIVVLIVLAAILCSKVESQAVTFSNLINLHYGTCCHVNWIYSFDKSIWMTPLYPWLITYGSNIATTLDTWRRYYDNYLTMHQFNLNSFLITNHQVPWDYFSGPGLSPVMWTFPDGIFTNLGHSVDLLTNQIYSHPDHINFNLIFAIHRYVIYPTTSQWNNLFGAIKWLNSRGCKIRINVCVVYWWIFWGFRRNLQFGPDQIGDFLRQIDPQRNVDVAVNPANNKQARAAFDALQRANRQSVYDRNFKQYQNYDQKALSSFTSQLKNAGVEYSQAQITSQDQLQRLLDEDLSRGNPKPRTSSTRSASKPAS